MWPPSGRPINLLELETDLLVQTRRAVNHIDSPGLPSGSEVHRDDANVDCAIMVIILFMV